MSIGTLIAIITISSIIIFGLIFLFIWLYKKPRNKKPAEPETMMDKLLLRKKELEIRTENAEEERDGNEAFLKSQEAELKAIELKIANLKKKREMYPATVKDKQNEFYLTKADNAIEKEKKRGKSLKTPLILKMGIATVPFAIVMVVIFLACLAIFLFEARGKKELTGQRQAVERISTVNSAARRSQEHFDSTMNNN